MKKSEKKLPPNNNKSILSFFQNGESTNGKKRNHKEMLKGELDDLKFMEDTILKEDENKVINILTQSTQSDHKTNQKESEVEVSKRLNNCVIDDSQEIDGIYVCAKKKN